MGSFNRFILFKALNFYFRKSVYKFVIVKNWLNDNFCEKFLEV